MDLLSFNIWRTDPDFALGPFPYGSCGSIGSFLEYEGERGFRIRPIRSLKTPRIT